MVSGRLQARAPIQADANLDVETKGRYTLETVKVTAIGEQQPWSRWMVNASGLIKEDVRFIGVLRVPKALTAFTIRVKAVFIDKLLFLERSRTQKNATYSCTRNPLSCVVSGK